MMLTLARSCPARQAPIRTVVTILKSFKYYHQHLFSEAQIFRYLIIFRALAW